MKKTNEDESRKKVIKNGMYFKYRDKYYIKIGNRCAEMDVNSSILLNEIETEEREIIFNTNCTLKMCMEELDKEVEECEK